MSQVKLTVAKNGPLRVSDPDGEIQLVDSDGQTISPANPNSFSICRCGASTKKPFCDGTHSKIGFEKAAEAVPESRE
ncbi:Zn-finger domain of CDGSH type-containing protein [Abditibacterium utsteinense]|uniref:Zn-finger domain of CDGSH type-containing protein n=1 Tax=Abditibacterium utsteinense TaxID=1960156 RepID=A0A2S8SSX6_9BACT|nr:CDGSH iron-sulfur domain-containing protein [Abditibacterium utsteinense]PQV63910.1 Zn-finger domain of CDGSH type-containing protein [Abditibacterium utsteinense]